MISKHIIDIHHSMFSFENKMNSIYSSFTVTLKWFWRSYGLWAIIVWGTFQRCYTTSNQNWYALSIYTISCFFIKNGVRHIYRSFTGAHRNSCFHYCHKGVTVLSTFLKCHSIFNIKTLLSLGKCTIKYSLYGIVQENFNVLLRAVESHYTYHVKII